MDGFWSLSVEPPRTDDVSHPVLVCASRHVQICAVKVAEAMLKQLPWVEFGIFKDSVLTCHLSRRE